MCTEPSTASLRLVAAVSILLQWHCSIDGTMQSGPTTRMVQSSARDSAMHTKKVQTACQRGLCEVFLGSALSCRFLICIFLSAAWTPFSTCSTWATAGMGFGA